MADPDALYSLPHDAVAFASSLSQILRGGAAEAAVGEELLRDGSRVVDDTFDLVAAMPCKDPLQPSLVFRVQHLNPKAAKMLRIPTNMMRGDHVAIYPYDVDSRQWQSERKLTVTSAFQQGHEAKSYVLSLTSFLELGFTKLKATFLKVELAGELKYSLPRSMTSGFVASGADICDVITTLVNAGAYWGAWAIFHLNPNATDRFKITLLELTCQGVVADLEDNKYQLTETYSSALVSSLVTEGGTFVLKRRNDVALEDRTVHELLELCDEQGFCIQPFRGKKAPPPLPLEDVKPEDKICWVNKSQLDVCKSYLECLCSLEHLQSKGHKFLLHRQKQEYYNDLLGRVIKAPQRQACIDDVADFNVMSKKVLALPGPHNKLAPKHGGDGCGLPPKAIKDGKVEGEPEEELPKASNSIEQNAFVDTNKSHWWGPFRFAFVERVAKSGANKGKASQAWQVTCRYHHDHGDPKSTACTKTLQFSGEEQRQQRAHELRAWCVAGRRVKHRKGPKGKPKLGHSGVPCDLFEAMSASELDTLLEQGLAADAWVEPEAPPLEDDGSSSSSSTSSSSSS